MKNTKILLLSSILTSLLIFNACGNTSTTSSINTSKENTSPSEVISSSDSGTSEESSSSNDDIIEVVEDKRVFTELIRINLQESNISYSLSIGSLIKVNIYLESQTNIKPSILVNYDDLNYENKEYIVKDHLYQLSFDFDNLISINQNINISIKDDENVIQSFTINIQSYLSSLLSLTQGQTGYDYNRFVSFQSTLTSYIAYIGRLQNYHNITEDNALNLLTQEQINTLFNSNSQNLYHSDWGNRDNLTIEGSLEGFNWIFSYLKDYSSPKLEYTFTYSGDINNLSSKVFINDVEEQIDIVDTQQTNSEGVKIYSLTTRSLAPQEYAYNVKVIVTNGVETISAGYSLTRALAKIDIDGNRNNSEKDLSNALYSLGKSLLWYSEVSPKYDFLPPINDNGIYTLTLGEYTYDDARLLVSSAYNSFGHYVYCNYSVCYSSEGATLVEQDTHKIEYLGENNYRVTLLGGTIDGIMANNGANVEIVIQKDTIINGALYRSWNDKNSATAGSIINDGGTISISSENDAKLIINGNIMAYGDLIFNSSNIEINSTNPNRAGIYLNGVVNEGVSNQKLIVNGDSNINIKSVNYGINSTSVNRELMFNDGNVSIEANNGINYCNLTLDKAEVTITSKHGYTIQESAPFTLKTISGDYETGILNLINKTVYNQYWDAYYTLKATTIDCNGGTINIEGTCKTGVVQASANALFNFKNCDVHVTSLNEGNGFGIDQENVVITIDVTSMVYTYDCFLPIGCWIQNRDTSVKLYIQGYFGAVNNSFAVSTCDDTTNIVEGSIVYINE